MRPSPKLNSHTRFLAAATLLLLAGCQPESDGRFAVSGSVTFDGKPLKQGTIAFSEVSRSGPTAGGAMITSGRYELPAAQGLPPGSYRVVISSPEEAATSEADYAAGRMQLQSKERIPAKYNAESTLVVEVSADGKNQFDFDLE